MNPINLMLKASIKLNPFKSIEGWGQYNPITKVRLPCCVIEASSR
jgi:hypothetical protein